MTNERKYLKQLASTNEQVKKLLDKFMQTLYRHGMGLKDIPEGEFFSFDKYPEKAKVILQQLEEVVKEIEKTVSKECKTAVTTAFAAQNLVLKGKSSLSDKAITQLRDNAADAFLESRTKSADGLSLSDRVWNYVSQSKSEFEVAMSLALETGIKEGRSAEEIGRTVRQYLNNPDMMYRRYHLKKTLSDGRKKDVVEWRRKVVDEDGKVHFIKEDLEKTGAGVYRSARQNALRLAATEINMAYHYADCMRWQNERFVLGVHIQVSSRYGLDEEGRPNGYSDMCEHLQGDYPKTFLWKGWHPRCRCNITPIIMSDEEYDKVMRMSKKKRDKYVSPNLVTRMPDNYNQYLSDNEDRIAQSIERGKQPYWIRDNYIDGDISKGFSWQSEEMKAYEDMKQRALSADLVKYTPEQIKNFEDIEKRLKQGRGLSMSYEDANTGKENPKYGTRRGYGVNCQTCVIAHELRRRGFNVEAKGNFDESIFKYYEQEHIAKESEGYRLGRWLNEDGSVAKIYYARTWSDNKYGKRMHPSKLDEFFADTIRNDGRYEIYVDWKKGNAHVFLAEKKDGKITFFDPQNGKTDVWKNYKDICKSPEVGVLRVDNKILNPAVAGTLIPLGELPVVDVVELRRVAIQKIAEERHKARTPEQEQAIRDAWKKHNDKIRIQRIADARHAERNDEIVQMQWEERQLRHKEIRRSFIKSFSRAYLEDWLDGRLDLIYTDSPEMLSWRMHHLEQVKIAVEKTNVLLDSISRVKPMYENLTQYKSSLPYYDRLVENVKKLTVVGEERIAVDLATKLNIFPDAEKLYLDVSTYKTSKKINDIVADALKDMEIGEIQSAYVKLQEANRIKIAREKDAERRARKKQGLDNKENKGKTATKSFSECTFEELQAILGDEMPYLLEKYEKSVKRDNYTSEEYLRERAEIERKLKDFFEGVNFCHNEKPHLLDERILENGILNTQQVETGWYVEERYSYSHFAFGFQKNQSTVPESKKFHASAYYRCGTPMVKDLTQAWKDCKAWGYGRSIIVFRKDRVVTTFTFGNSLSQETIPSLVGDPKVCSIDSKIMKNYKDAKYVDPSVVSEGARYIELQYLPLRSSGKIMPADMQCITLGEHPELIHPKKIWDRWYEEGVDIYYHNGTEVVLYRKGKPMMTAEEAQAKYATIKDELDGWIGENAAIHSKDLSFDALKTYISDNDYISIVNEYDIIKRTMQTIRDRQDKLKDLIPDVEKWNKQFTMDELELSYKAIQDKIKWIETRFDGRNEPDRVIAKLLKEMEYVENPSLYKAGAQRYSTWEVAKEAYQRKRDELIYTYRKDSIERKLNGLRSYKTDDKNFRIIITELEELVRKGSWGSVENMITVAENEMLMLDAAKGISHLKLGEASHVLFASDAFTQAKMDAAMWFKNSDDVDKAFKAADDYMTKYAQEMWKNLTTEEKHVLWLYTDGSKYINDEMLGSYCLRMQSAIDNSLRNGLADANTITTIIENAPRLKDDIWMQSGKSQDAFYAIFNEQLRYADDLTKLVGLEGQSNLFMSCHSASDGAFVKDTNTGVINDVVFSIFLPKGTKGIYMEPFASYGDDLRWKEGFDWTGRKRKCKPSNQVEFLLQRGSKFRITKAYRKDGKWHIDLALIEQMPQSALNETIYGLEGRRLRPIRKPTL